MVPGQTLFIYKGVVHETMHIGGIYTSPMQRLRCEFHPVHTRNPPRVRRVPHSACRNLKKFSLARVFSWREQGFRRVFESFRLDGYKLNGS